MIELEKRFIDKVNKTNSCWIWVGAIGRDGYGGFGIGGKRHAAHRVSYELYTGEIPQGLEIDHLCSNKKCVNPSHLEAVTHGENIRRHIQRFGRFRERSIRCKRGHLFRQYAKRQRCLICQNGAF